mmetsp:Transcript_28621/g.71236  ORF Transcript_28621/g.71236 Transcript_28621/m.71236 type:complete len:88 (-) Transcript_28621:72-335(-)
MGCVWNIFVRGCCVVLRAMCSPLIFITVTPCTRKRARSPRFERNTTRARQQYDNIPHARSCYVAFQAEQKQGISLWTESLPPEMSLA